MLRIFLLVLLLALASSLAVSDALEHVVVEGNGNINNRATTAAFMLEGIHLTDTKEVNGVTLFRNGEGVRMFTILGMNLRMYVAGFWTESPLQTVEEVVNCNRPKQFDFTFLRKVSQGRVTAAWQRQLDASVTHKDYEGYQADRDAFIAMLGAIEQGGTLSILLVGEELDVIDQGVFKGKIKGRDFQRAFLSMWFGEQAVTNDLKTGLLGQARAKLAMSS